MAAIAREYHDYVFTWIGRNISYLDGVTSAGPPQSGIQVSTGFLLPRNAAILQIFIATQTAFNAATTNTIDIGTLAAPQFILGAQALGTPGVGVFTINNQTTGGVLSAVTDIEIFTRYNFTGANPTAGVARVAIEFVVDPDRRK